MKICIVMGGHFSQVKGGAQYQAMLLAQELAKRPELTVCYITRNVSEQMIDGYALIPVPGIPRLRRIGPITDAPQLYRILRREQPDVVYQQALQGDTGVCAFYARRFKKRFVFHIASDFDVHTRQQLDERGIVGGPGGLDKRCGEYGLRNASALVAQTDYQAEALTENYGLRAQSIIRNFLPIPKPAEAPKATRAKVAWVANFKRVKRPEAFVELAERLQNLNADFVMIGRGGQEELYGQLYRRIDELANIQYLGEMEVEGVEKELESSHLLVNTSMVEGFPNTFIQAWFREVPVVTLGVNTDNLLAPGSDFGVCTNSMDELVAAVSELVLKPAELAALGHRARVGAEQKYSMANAQSLIQVLTESGADCS